MHNIEKLSLSAWDKTLDIIWTSPLMTFDWSSENALFLEIKIKAILDKYKKTLNYLFDPHKNTKFVIISNEINILLCEDSPLPFGFIRSEKNPIITFSLNHGLSKMEVEHFESNKAVFKQEVLETDLIYEFVRHILFYLESVAASPEVKCIIDHFSKQIRDENLSRKNNKRIKP